MPIIFHKGAYETLTPIWQIGILGKHMVPSFQICTKCNMFITIVSNCTHPCVPQGKHVFGWGVSAVCSLLCANARLWVRVQLRVYLHVCVYACIHEYFCFYYLRSCTITYVRPPPFPLPPSPSTYDMPYITEVRAMFIWCFILSLLINKDREEEINKEREMISHVNRHPRRPTPPWRGMPNIIEGRAILTWRFV